MPITKSVPDLAQLPWPCILATRHQFEPPRLTLAIRPRDTKHILRDAAEYGMEVASLWVLGGCSSGERCKTRMDEA